jgi:hypothetical protein
MNSAFSEYQAAISYSIDGCGIDSLFQVQEQLTYLVFL